jgi:hypothetical protein
MQKISERLKEAQVFESVIGLRHFFKNEDGPILDTKIRKPTKRKGQARTVKSRLIHTQYH